MTVFRAEIARVLRTGWLWVVLALCVLANLLPVVTAPSAPAYERAVAGIAAEGTRVDAVLERSIPSSEADRAVRRDLTQLSDVFAETDYAGIGRVYSRALHASGYVAEAVRTKYALAADAAADRVRDGAGRSLYLAGRTRALHAVAFRTVLPAVTIEAILLTTLLVLHVIGVEQTRGTASLLFSTRIGRRLALTKAVVATVLSLAAVVLLSAVAWAGLAMKYPVAAVARSDIESGFNLVDDPLLGIRPFLTWSPMTVAGYAGATLMLTVAITVVYAIVAAAITTVVPEPYLAFATLLLTNGLVFALPGLVPASPLPFLLVLTPVWLWLKQPSWFTDGDFDVLWPRFETLGVSGAVVAALLIGLAAHRHLLRKDLR